MFQVIEHIPSPVEYLKELIPLLNEEKIHIILATPNTNSLGARLFKKDWNQFATHHISLFNKKSLSELFHKLNIAMIDYDGARMYDYGYFPILLNIPRGFHQKVSKTGNFFLSTDGLMAHGIYRSP
jgi:2-polyprenyl-3-methyl-5-hydroxy-6-metoxy-1,4-benzoquinol methylase